MKKVCIVTPFHKDNLSEYESISLKTIQFHFKEYDKFLVSFKENNLKLQGFKKVNFSKYFFKNLGSYNKLCSSIDFYGKFSNYEYMLICHLDVIVLKNNLKYFTDLNLSYLGALTGTKNIFDRTRKLLWGTRYFCNGGFSLRKISDFISVLESNNMSFPFNYYTLYELTKSSTIKYLSLFFKTKYSKSKNLGEYFALNFYLHEDTFWSYFATIFYKNYKLPSKKICLEFCFEGDPNFFFKKNSRQLPLALHGHHNYLEFIDKINSKYSL